MCIRDRDDLDGSAYSAVIPGLDPATLKAALKVALATYKTFQDISAAVQDAWMWLQDSGHDIDYLDVHEAVETALKEGATKEQKKAVKADPSKLKVEIEEKNKEIAKRFKEGDANAWTELMDAFEPKINQIINRSQFIKNPTFYDTSRSALVSDLQAELVALTNSYKEEKNTSFNAHIFRNLPLRIHRILEKYKTCLLYTSPSPRDRTRSRMPSSA